jgi:hypothetical protein
MFARKDAAYLRAGALLYNRLLGLLGFYKKNFRFVIHEKWTYPLVS